MAKTDFTRDQTINIAVKMGKILLKSGAETYRVEDTISRCCLAHGYEVDPFVTPTVMWKIPFPAAAWRTAMRLTLL